MEKYTESLKKLSEIFINTIAAYNQNTYIWQIIICLIGFILTIFLYKWPNKTIKILMKLYLCFCFSWIAIVFFIMYGSTEFHKELTAAFFGVIACCFLVDVFINKIKFERERKFDKAIIIFYLLFLAYPFVSILLGRNFPQISTWLIPCPLTVFTITLLTSFMPKKNYIIYVLLLLWALTGLPKSIMFNIQEDLILGFAGVFSVIVLILQRKKTSKFTNFSFTKHI